MGLPAGTRLGPYEIVSALGAGGMGEVYRAKDGRLGRDVAVKILPHSLARDPDRLRRFEQEARAVAALNHPNLLTVFDVGTIALVQPSDPNGAAPAAEVPYIVSELLQGMTIRERLASGPIPQRKAVDYATQIARGLAASHERGIVHRDLKPDNIFITADGRIKILDFGLAKLTEGFAAAADDGATVQSATMAGMVLGTIGYMSPEQVRGMAADARSDIFSFGVVLFEMLTGQRAFDGKSSADVMSAILKDEPPDLTTGNREISPALDRIVHHCIEKDPQQRFQSSSDIAFHLSELTGTVTASGTHAIAVSGLARPLPRWTWAAGGVAALALIVAGTWLLARATHQTQPPKFVQLSFQQGLVDSARFLPDGQSIVCASRWGSETTMSLYTGRTDSQGLRPMGIAAVEVASVSSGGELLIVQDMKPLGPGYVRAGTLARVALGGGAPRPVLDLVQYADWAPDGKDFAVIRFVPENHAYRLEYPVGKVLYETSGWLSHPRFSRDGKRIAFLDHPIFGDDQGVVAIVDLNGNKKQLSPSYTSTQGLAWSPKGDEIWFSAIADGVYRSLYAAGLSGRVRALLSAPGNLDIQDALPDGRVLVNHGNIRRILTVVTPDHPEGRDFSWMDWAYSMRFSADSKQIVFGDQHSGPMYGAFIRNLDGSPAVRLGDGDPMDLSPDGKWVISRLPTTPAQLLLLPTGAGETRKLPNSSVIPIVARWLTNDTIVMIGNEPGHRGRTYLLELNGTQKPVTPEGVNALVATPDGKYLLGRAGDSPYQLFPIDGSTPQPVTQLQKDDRALAFNLDGSAIFVSRDGPQGANEVWQVNRGDGKRTRLRIAPIPDGPSVITGVSVTVSRDGKNFAYEHGRTLSTEYVVEGLR